ncbi:dolichyl-diphosphooligosaccharide--protein glycosyltransferase subunit Swp1p [[Candida] anglica]|uniref:Dolichyl-diphosphooligosaccharide--protein glycosyltransferase subunit Swp1p n=1 Tax=[Candida] anglica TaxID=148631 RepID=A0ABP0EIG9_9ASCO
MRFSVILFALQCACAWAYTITEGSVSVGDDKVEIGEFNAQVVTPLSFGAKDKIDVSLKVDELSTKPHQAVITIGDGNGLDLSFVPTVLTASNTVKLSIPAAKLPESLKSQLRLFVKVILADKDNSGNLYRTLAELEPTSELRTSSKYKKAERVGIKPEIHHIFREDPSTVNPIIPLVFIGGAIVLFLGLLIAWTSALSSNLLAHFSDLTGLQLLYDFSFLSCLFGYEVTFARYYLGASIFTTLFYVFVLAGPSIYFGSRVFRDLAKFRKIGKL